jgi:nucleotide-binding universal stress UspA family protein
MKWFEGKKAVVPIDFGEHSLLAVDTALDIIGRPADIHVIYVAPDLLAVEPGFVWENVSEDARRQNLEESFARMFSAEKYRGLQFVTRFGDPGHHVADYAQEIGADLIILPSHGRTGLKRFLIGSVAERIVRLAHCPVLVLRS